MNGVRGDAHEFSENLGVIGKLTRKKENPSSVLKVGRIIKTIITMLYMLCSNL